MQAVGRCIRHRYDYGAIILLDVRYKTPRSQQQLPRWVRGNIKVRSITLTAVQGNGLCLCMQIGAGAEVEKVMV
ncbi:helicase C-terminal domain-containing protein [Agrobacterium sp.]|uniref:helicase C-terminal domain-containing protein n=1 Tax=Agrobacterium sp. TaxID=361 RepID=UPI0040333BC5